MATPPDTPEDPNLETRLLYRCACGQQLAIDQAQGGSCESCGRTVTAEKLQTELSLTTDLTTQLGTQFLNQDDDGSSDLLDIVGVDPLIGQSFGHFRIIDQIGRGGMGYVYRAIDTSLQRFVAVKVLRSGVGWANESSSDTEVETLLNEAISQARVNHPNVVTIYFVGKKQREPFLAMELVQGIPLNRLLGKQPLTYQEIISYGIQTAQALQFSHQLDVIHGDIKPSNLLVQSDGTIKLSDFGMARLESGSNLLSSGGTPSYLAPELIKGGKSTVVSDIYSLGATFYEMTFNELPVKLTGRKPAGWTAVHESEPVVYPVPWPEHLPEIWQKILQKMLHKNPDRRYQNYDALMDDLKEVEAISNIKAKTVPRLLAGLFDFVSVLLVAATIQYLLFDVLRLGEKTDSSLIVMLVSLADLLPLLIYSLSVFVFRQSVGRHLLYLRVVNRYGLKAGGRVMLTRSFVRMAFVWLLIASMVMGSQGETWPQIVRAIFAISAVAILVTQVCLLAFRKDHRTLQDYIHQTDVVLDT